MVGPWRVVAWAGCGVHGAVYHAVRVGEEHPAPVALKVALFAKDPRFAREVALLSLTRHPSIPRLIDTGDWQHPSGSLHPYLAMEWIDGAPLYDWAWQHNPTCQQVLRLLAQLARALAAVHAHGAVHRDVKGDNVMVRRTDSRAMLTDFGMGKYPGASTLTPRSTCSLALPPIALRRRGSSRCASDAMPRLPTPPGRRMTSTRWESRATASSPASTLSSGNPARTRPAPGNWRTWRLPLRTCSTLAWIRASAR